MVTLQHTIYRNHCAVHQSTNPQSTCVHPCMRLLQCRKKLQSTWINVATHQNCRRRNHTRGKWGIATWTVEPLKSWWRNIRGEMSGRSENCWACQSEGISSNTMARRRDGHLTGIRRSPKIHWSWHGRKKSWIIIATKLNLDITHQYLHRVFG